MDKPIIAFMYDFDKTLCTKDMQEYTFIPSLGMKPGEFWGEIRKLTSENDMDPMLGYLYYMIDKARAAHKGIRREDFVEAGRDLELFPGVKSWFDRMNKFAQDQGAVAEHYIISSGLREIIEGSEIAGEFKEIFACEFFYDENGVAVWPKNLVNYTTKTQFLFRINKGVLDLSDNEKLNDYQPEAERRVPFSHMIYLGDGATDVPCMKLVKVNGGHSIAVYGGKQDVAGWLLDEGRVDFVCKADYTRGSELENTIEDIVRKVVAEWKVELRKSSR